MLIDERTVVFETELSVVADRRFDNLFAVVFLSWVAETC